MSIALDEAARLIQQFQGASLSQRIAALEASLQDAQVGEVRDACIRFAVDDGLIRAAAEFKRQAGQINVIIHAAGIVVALRRILEPGEVVERVSLGAGNTGRDWDVETDRRIAEFKFITWRGGPESIRQNSLFKDFYYLAEDDGRKSRHLYIMELARPLAFLKGRRSLESVTSKNAKLRADVHQRYGTRFGTVGEYYRYREGVVQLHEIPVDVPELSVLAAMQTTSEAGL